MSEHTIYTVGYRGRTVDQVLEILREAGIENPVLCDVRRRTRGARIAAGWDADHLDMSGFTYMPYNELGNMGKSHLWQRGPDAEEALDELADDVVRWTHRVVLLCAEVNATECHRSEVADAVANIIRASGAECEVRHLGCESLPEQRGQHDGSCPLAADSVAEPGDVLSGSAQGGE